MPEGDLDARVRSRTFEFLREQTALHGEVLPLATLTRGFQFDGQRVPIRRRDKNCRPSTLASVHQH